MTPLVYVSKTIGTEIRDRVRMRLGSRDSCRYVGRISRLKGSRADTFLLVSHLSDISAELMRSIRSRAGATHRRYLVFVEGLPVEALAARIACLDVRRPDRLHLVRAATSDARVDLLARLLGGLCSPSSRDCIVDAWLEADDLVLLSPRFRRLRVPLASLRSLKPLRGLSAGDLKDFRIDPDGAFIHWPTIHAHMGWTQLENLVSPRRQLRRRQRSPEFNHRYGRAVRTLRKLSGLSQSRIEGLTERHLRRIEKGEQRATPSSLQALARAHGLSTAEYQARLREALED